MSEAGATLDPALVVQQASMLADVGRAEEALALVNRALGENPDAANLQLTAGWLYLKLDQPAEARPILAGVVGSQPDASGAVYLLSVAEASLHNLAVARSHADHALELEPDNARYHLQVAVVATAGKITTADRALARERIASALELAPEEAAISRTSAELEWRMGDLPAAQAFARRALSLEPDNPDLLYLEAVLAGQLADSLATNSTSSTLWSTAQQVSGMGNILGGAPTHAAAQRLLYSRVWGQILKVASAPHIPLVVLAITIGGAMGDGPTLTVLIVGGILAFAWPLFRVLVASVVLVRAPAGYVRQQVRGGGGAAWRISGSAIGGAVALAGVIVVLWVRDPVVIRLTLVAMAVASVGMAAASAAWFERYISSAHGSGIIGATPFGLESAAAYRGALTRVVIWRLVIAALLSVAILLVASSTRSDAAPVLALALTAWVVPVVYALWRIRRLEARWRDDAEFEVSSAGPGTVSGALLALLILGLAAAVVAALVQVPWAPNARDSDAAYEPYAGTSQCAGRPASRLSCIIELNRSPSPFPSITVPDITIPDIEIPDIEIPEFDPDVEVNP